MPHWLVKTESNTYSIADFKRDRTTAWSGVRNYQARNFLREMKPGDKVLFYHSVIDPTGIMGLAQVKKGAYPDPTQFDKKSEYFDEKASKENPRWFSPDLEFIEEFSEPLGLAILRKEKGLKDMLLLQRGSRLSVQPVSEKQFQIILGLVGGK